MTTTLATPADLLERVDAIVPVKTYEMDPRFDYAPGLVLGIQAIVGTVWWLIINLVYLKNISSDQNLTNLQNNDVVPVAWFWEQASNDTKYMWLAIAHIFYWITYLIVSVVELIAWFFYLAEWYAFPRFYFSTIGYWGSLIAYFLGPLFTFIYYAAILEYNVDNFPGDWTLFLFITGLILWLVHGLLHIFFVPPLLAFIDAQPEKECQCDLPEVAPVPEDASEEEKVAYEDASRDRANLCVIQCPIDDGKRCPIYRSRGLITAEEFDVACAAILAIRDEQAEEAEGSEALTEQDDDEDVELEEGSEAETPEGEEGWI